MNHPEARRAEIAASVAGVAAAVGVPHSWQTCYGWLIMLRVDDDTWRLRHLPPGTSYADASAARDRELSSSDRFTQVWLKRKGFEA